MGANYQVSVRGPIPDDLAQKISAAHASAILQCQESSTNGDLPYPSPVIAGTPGIDTRGRDGIGVGRGAQHP